MGLLRNLLILLPQFLLVVHANNFSIIGWNITNHTHPNGVVDQIKVKEYTKVINELVFRDPISEAVTSVFSEAFKNCHWCYPPYRCFQIGGPFISPDRPISLSPYPPWRMNVKMELYTTRNPTTPFIFYPDNVSQLNNSHFNSSSTIGTKFIIGGYLAGSGVIVAQRLIPAFLNYSDYNVFNVDWFAGSVTTYEQAVANSRMAGAMVGRFIELINNATGYPLSNIHLIGHSLGAHVCGYAGEYLAGKLGRISGLDAAGPYFENTDPLVRLDVSDAIFVDAIHTDAGSLLTGNLGIKAPVGDIDFYPNGGSHQPGCALFDPKPLSQYEDISEVVADLIACCHLRVVYLYTESIYNAKNSSCQFQSYACPNYVTYLMGLQCNNCGLNGTNCAQMGLNADKYAKAGHQLPSQKKFYLYTNSDPPYCQK